MPQSHKAELLALGERAVQMALDSGADVAEASVRLGRHLSAKVRMREPELVEEACSKSIGLRVIHNHRVAVSYTSDMSDAGINTLVEDATTLAALSQADPYVGPPDPSELSRNIDGTSLDLFDVTIGSVTAKQAIERARLAEQAALDFDKRITNSEGATFTTVSGGSALVTSGGFRGFSEGTYASLSVHPIADDADNKKRSGYYWSARRHISELENDEDVGREAARRTLGKLGARKIATQEAPVIFDPDAARSILGLLAGCVSGEAIWRQSSYLVGRELTAIASSIVTVIDDPLIVRGPGSRLYDGEGLAARKNVVVEQGILKTYLLDCYSARKLGRSSTANAGRSSTGSPHVATSNFMLQPGATTHDDLIRNTDKGLYVTDMMGFGFNAVTGDFSRGASGYWIENGQLAYPVSEVTISLNLDELLQRIDAVCSDLDLRSSTASPTFRVSSMTIAGT